VGYLEAILACRVHDPSHFRPLVVGGRVLGHVKHAFASALGRFPRVFEVDDEAVRLSEALDGFDARSHAVEEVLRALVGAGDLRGLYGEPFPVLGAWGEEPLLRVDRAAVTPLGVKAFGIHVNGTVRTSAGVAMWVARRSDRVRVAPGRFDHLVAGGQPHGLTLEENLVKECAEEAGIPADLARRAVAAGSISYRLETEEGLKDDTLFPYDLELPEAFEPTPCDGEVAAFERWPMDRVMRAVREEPEAFKFNVPPVLVAYFVRHGWLRPDEPDRDAIVRALRS